MPNLYADDIFELHEDDDLHAERGMYFGDDLLIEEDDMDDETMFVTEDDNEIEMGAGNKLPGSNFIWEEEPEEPVQDARDSDWKNDKDPSKFITYLRDKLSSVPKHSGNTVPGCERAVAFMKGLGGEISQAMRSDYEGKIDESEIDSYRKQIEEGIDRLEGQIKKLRGKRASDTNIRLVSNGDCNKCEATTPMWHNIAEDKMVCLSCEGEEAAANSDAITKEAGLPVINVFITPFERAIVGTIINSKVSAGKNIEETYMHMKNKYNFTPREELGIQQLIMDYGYPFNKDRGRLNEKSDPAANDGIEWPAQYHA